jgi:hypothetical protein
VVDVRATGDIEGLALSDERKYWWHRLKRSSLYSPPPPPPPSPASIINDSFLTALLFPPQGQLSWFSSSRYPPRLVLGAQRLRNPGARVWKPIEGRYRGRKGPEVGR